MAWYGMLAPAGTPKEILDKLSKAIAEIQQDPTSVEKITAGGATPMIAGPEEFGKFFTNEVNTWAGVITQAKMEKVQ